MKQTHRRRWRRLLQGLCAVYSITYPVKKSKSNCTKKPKKAELLFTQKWQPKTSAAICRMKIYFFSGESVIPLPAGR